MKRIIMTLITALALSTAMAVPALNKPLTFKQSDGSEITVRLIGDERFSTYMTMDRITLERVGDDFYYKTATGISAVMAHNEGSRTQQEVSFIAANRDMMTLEKIVEARATSMPLHAPAQAPGLKDWELPPVGSPNIPIILVNFSDFALRNGSNARSIFRSQFNTMNKSVLQYFRDNSRGQFTPNFEILGPVTLPNTRSYYGKNDESGHDQHLDQMVVDAVKLLPNEDWSRFDNNNDGTADKVIVLFAGPAEAQGATSNTIWPCMSYLLSRDRFKMGNTEIGEYAVFNETSGSSDTGTETDGIGTFCHEFSHCLGLPDFYDTSYSGHYGMGRWSIMDNGCYNRVSKIGDTPCGYTAYEKNYMGWMPLISPVKGFRYSLNPIDGNDGEAVKIVNDQNSDEYYILEYRKKQGWNVSMRSEGLFAYHVTHDKWYQINATDLQRMTPICADNTWSLDSEQGDCYPYNGNNKITDSSTPAATLNLGTKKLMGKPVTEITKTSDHVSFFYCRKADYDFRLEDGNGNYVYYKIIDEYECEVVGVENKNCTKLTITAAIFAKISSTTTLSYSVTSIGSSALSGLPELTEVTLPKCLKRIKRYAFNGCKKLSKINLSSLTQLDVIEGYAFYNCSSLTSVYLPTYLDEIGDYAFAGCTNLQEIHLGDRTRILGNYILGVEKPKKLSKLTGQFTRNNEFLIYNFELQAWAGYGKTVCNVPSWATSVGPYAFYNDTNLKEVTFYRTVTEIGGYAFCGCSNLTSVQFSDNSVKKIRDCAFKKCINLPTITLPNKLEELGSGAFMYCYKLDNIEIPSPLKHLPAEAFYCCYSLENVKFPLTLIEIGDRCFCYTKFKFGSYLSYFPYWLERIGDWAFYQTKCEAAQFREGLKSIGEDAFCFCPIHLVDLPSTLEEIGEGAFSECYKIEDVNCHRKKPIVFENSNIFDGSSIDKLTLYVPRGSKSAYQKATMWKDFGWIYDTLDPIEVTGDVNGDGKVDISDLNAIINLILGTAPSSYDGDADVNGDGKVDITDVNAIINIILR